MGVGAAVVIASFIRRPRGEEGLCGQPPGDEAEDDEADKLRAVDDERQGHRRSLATRWTRMEISSRRAISAATTSVVLHVLGVGAEIAVRAEDLRVNLASPL